ncbi:hypothetical protein PVAND_009927 [Polypedilum vanderplanki]|uniref:Cytochrome c oxidase copper chaperone n=1 Tax=Polypedilum vanderplanki TaxID=319348 RepID=A0A9J6CF66_POLVA|nr:hypothetical protein PVAND_009927 [Polypedilum vanderplanki]
MGNSTSSDVKATAAQEIVNSTTEVIGEKKGKCKACCACPETKKARDECIVKNGEENCTELIEKHKKCMRDMGFNI